MTCVCQHTSMRLLFLVVGANSHFGLTSTPSEITTKARKKQDRKWPHARSLPMRVEKWMVRVPFPTLDLSWLTLSSKLVFLARTQACQRQLSLT
ncbi:hypothetical protein BKA67DRAFT_585436 [Truncatella angustata]|uniref:Secreted protein n=1 Tax=Truncatella angustata TaxID=152316 RepID=A0A9P8RJQ9_9PEZI|nr:uncharacterized protein BKA67DRAFT_585436 [Truncatella angustata]KAH6645553.1 hypothetical protein BKA67DRAFT_585436 [Truncatella angustata]